MRHLCVIGIKRYYIKNGTINMDENQWFLGKVVKVGGWGELMGLQGSPVKEADSMATFILPFHCAENLGALAYTIILSW